MHIAHVLRCMAERAGGPPRSSRGLGRAVARQGHEVTYWTAANRQDMVELAGCGPEIRRYSMNWPQTWFRSQELAAELTRHIHKIDLLHVHGVWSHPNYMAARLGRRSETPYIIAPRGELEPWRMRYSLLKHAKKQAYLWLLGRAMFQGAACMHAITPREMNGFREAGYRGPVTIVPNGIDPDAYHRLPPPTEAEKLWPVLRGRRVVLFLARLKEEKGLDQLIPAWQQVVRERAGYDDALLVLAGPDDRGYRAVVEQLVQRHNVARQTLLTGMVRGREKLALISRAQFYTLPSYSEGFSMAVLENMAAAKPILITPGCNFPEVASAGAGLCVPPDADALADALRQMLDMPAAELDSMGSRGRELVARNYSWQSSAEKMLLVYQCILAGREIPLYPQPPVSTRTAA